MSSRDSYPAENSEQLFVSPQQAQSDLPDAAETSTATEAAEAWLYSVAQDSPAPEMPEQAMPVDSGPQKNDAALLGELLVNLQNAVSWGAKDIEMEVRHRLAALEYVVGRDVLLQKMAAAIRFGNKYKKLKDKTQSVLSAHDPLDSTVTELWQEVKTHSPWFIGRFRKNLIWHLQRHCSTFGDKFCIKLYCKC